MILSLHTDGNFNHGNFCLRHFIADRIHHMGGFEAQETRHFQVSSGFNNALFPERMFKDFFAENWREARRPHIVPKRARQDR